MSIANLILNNDQSRLKFALSTGVVEPNAIIKCLGVAPLHLAVCFAEDEKSKENIKILLNAGADPNLRSVSYGRVTPVHVAIQWLRADVLKLLLKYGGNPDIVDDKGDDSLSMLELKSVNPDMRAVCQILASYYSNLRLKLSQNNNSVEKKIASLDSLILEKNMKNLNLSSDFDSPVKNVQKFKTSIPTSPSIYGKSQIRRSATDRRFNGYPTKIGCILEGICEIPKCESIELPNFENLSPSKNVCRYFNYILLDARRTLNLPSLRNSLDNLNMFRIFILSIFYIGKGTKSRPLEHLNETKNKLNGHCGKISKKDMRIAEIWKCGRGVVSLNVFQNATESEAYFNEYCMIKSLGVRNLANEIEGRKFNFHNLSEDDCTSYGISLLSRALEIYLNEGERQISLENLP